MAGRRMQRLMAATDNPPCEVFHMSLRIATLSSALVFGLTLVLGAGSAVAGDGKSCGGKNKGESAAVVVPAQPQA